MDGFITPPTIPTAPTISLPPLARLATHSTAQIQQALENLRRLYCPAPAILPTNLALPKRNPALRQLAHDDGVPDSGYASAEDGEDDDCDEGEGEEEDDLALLRADPFERAYAIKWTTGFISRSDSWTASSDEHEARSALLDNASALLSIFTGDDTPESECALTRAFEFPLGPGGEGGVIRVELNDAALSREDHTSVGLQSWGSAVVLAERMCADPGAFSLIPEKGEGGDRMSVLELGAGTGMLSIVAAKLLLSSPSETGEGPKIIATDYHPSVLANLSLNVRTNFPSSSPITVHPLDWEHPPPPSSPKFPLILAADVIYYPQHALWIRACVARVLAPGGVFWLIVPVRTTGRHEGMAGTVEGAFPWAGVGGEKEGGERELKILSREDVARQGSVGRADEGGYRLYKIGWAR